MIKKPTQNQTKQPVNGTNDKRVFTKDNTDVKTC